MFILYTFDLFDMVGGAFYARPFAGASKRGTLDGIPTKARFDCPKGLAINDGIYVLLVTLIVCGK